MHYMHVLRDHVPGLMEFWFTALNWGYGMFSTTAGEHLNKRLKIYEAEHTVQGDDRFARIIYTFMAHLSGCTFEWDVENVIVLVLARRG